MKSSREENILSQILLFSLISAFANQEDPGKFQIQNSLIPSSIRKWRERNLIQWHGFDFVMNYEVVLESISAWCASASEFIESIKALNFHSAQKLYTQTCSHTLFWRYLALETHKCENSNTEAGFGRIFELVNMTVFLYWSSYTTMTTEVLFNSIHSLNFLCIAQWIG